MAIVDRRMLRDQMKREFKKFVKENRLHKNMTFAQFSRIVKLNLAAKAKPLASSVLDATDTHTHTHTHTDTHGEFDNMFSSVVEEPSDQDEVTE